MRKLGLLFILVSLVSCSQMLEIGYEGGINPDCNISAAETKSVIPNCSLNKDELLHMFQSSHIAMLINGVIQKDSIYIQTLTDEDIVSLGITEKEMEFSSDYIKTLKNNKYTKQ
jgi:hypothetical protein